MPPLAGVQLTARLSRVAARSRAAAMRVLWSVLLCLIFVQDYSGDARLPLPLHERVRAVPVDLFPGKPARRRIGALTYLGGIHLIERGRAVGGYSAIQVAGDRITLVSDGGVVLSFGWTGGAALRDVRYSALRDGPGRGWAKWERDSESLARDPATGTMWVGYEGSNAIWRYTPDLSRATGHVRPAFMRRWPSNGGAESLARMPDGGFVVISEARGWPGGPGRAAFRFAGDPVDGPTRGFAFGYQGPRRSDPSDAAALPDGRLIVLNRRLGLPDGFSTIVTRVDAGAIRPMARVRSREIARLEAPALHDNFEGVAVSREHGRTIVWLVSDDNQFFLQRTLLLKFALDD